MRNLLKIIKSNISGSIGIGAMIIFIAMVLVAGIAASVLVQTANNLETTAMETGAETTDEVSTGMRVVDIEGYKSLRSIAYNDTSGVIWRMENSTWLDRETLGQECLMWNNDTRIHNMTITVAPRAGSADIDLSQTVLEISNSTTKCLLTFGNSSAYATSVASNGVFASDVFNLDPDEFGIIELEDADSSASAATPVINRGDKVMLSINASACFQGVQERTDVWGMVIPEDGAPAIFAFRTPAAFTDTVYDLY